MSRNQDIDKYIKGKIGKPSTPYSEADWSAMEAMLDAEDRGFMFFAKKYAIAILGVLLIGMLTYTFIAKPEGTESAPTGAETKVQKGEKSAQPKIVKATDETDSVHFDAISANEDPNEMVNKPATKVNERLKTNLTSPIVSLPEKKSIAIQEIVGSENPVVDTVSVSNTPLNEHEYLVAKKIDSVSRHDVYLPSISSVILDSSGYSFKLPSVNNESLTINRVWTYFLSPYVQYSMPYLGSHNAIHAEDASIERVTNTWGAGLSFQLERRNLNFKMGLGYSYIESITNYSRPVVSTTYDTSYTLQSRIYRSTLSGKNLALVQQDITATNSYSLMPVCEDCKSKIEYLDIPLAIQYKVKRKRLNIYGELGANVSVPLSVSGYYTLNKTGHEVGYPEELLKSQANTVVRASLALGCGYSINSRLGIYTQMGYRKGLVSILERYDNQPKDLLFRAGLNIRL